MSLVPKDHGGEERTEEKRCRVPVELSILLDAVNRRFESVIGQTHEKVTDIHNEGAWDRRSKHPFILGVQDL